MLLCPNSIVANHVKIELQQQVTRQANSIAASESVCTDSRITFSKPRSFFIISQARIRQESDLNKQLEHHRLEIAELSEAVKLHKLRLAQQLESCSCSPLLQS